MSGLGTPIGEFCKTGSGSTPSRATPEHYGGNIPWVKSGELQEGIITTTDECVTERGVQAARLKLIPKGTLLVAMYGATVGRTAILGIDATTNQAICHIRPDPARAIVRYVWHALRAKLPELLTKRVGGAQPNISQETIRSTAIPLPPLPEQRRIADILDKADAIRRKRKEAIALTEQLLHSTFLEMFGPKASGYANWNIGTIESLAADTPNSMRTGPFGSDLRHSEFVDDGVAVLGIDNAVQNRFAWGERRFITHEKYEGLRRYTVLPNDVIITIMGTTGRSAVVPDDIPRAITTKHLATITLDRERAEPEFVSQALFRHPEVLRQIAASTRGAIMGGLNLGLIKNLKLSIPPIERQREFTKITANVRALSSRLDAARNTADTLFVSLVHRAFSGQLAG